MCTRAHAGSFVERMVLPATPLSVFVALILMLLVHAVMHPLAALLLLSTNSNSSKPRWLLEMTALVLLAAFAMAAAGLTSGLLRLRRSRMVAVHALPHGGALSPLGPARVAPLRIESPVHESSHPCTIRVAPEPSAVNARPHGWSARTSRVAPAL
jgi:hypothetical protein